MTRNGWLDMGRKAAEIPHESFAQVAGYFFYFGHYYAALCIGGPAGTRIGPCPGPPGPAADPAPGIRRLVVGLPDV